MSPKNTLQIEYLPPEKLKNYHRQLRKSKKQIKKTVRMIETCGLITPIVVDKNKTVVVGLHLFEAARQLKMETVPVIQADHLDDQQVRILRIAYDRIAEEAEWDKKQLAAEFSELKILIPDLTITGFELDEIDLCLDIVFENDPSDTIPEVREGPSIIRPGDLYVLGKHRLYCGDALEEKSYSKLLDGEKAQMCFTDAPYNVPIAGHVGNSGKIQHAEFKMASGEMDEAEFTDFLAVSHRQIALHSIDGAIIFSCMDWRHIGEILNASRDTDLSFQNLCIWVKDNGGMGSLYRSRHELVFVFKNGKAKHINNVKLGSNGRYRTNVWEYAGVNSFGGGRMDELEMHPTVKPLEMVADAIKDCSKRGGIILDPFGGSGTTLIAAEQTDREARLIELDPHYCDVIVHRWQKLTGHEAIHSDTGKTFSQTEAEQGGHNE